MKKTARVIVTYDCTRNCPNCCNEHIGNVPQVKFEDLLKYEELAITGGEPMMIGARIVEMIHRLHANGFNGKIWLYTAELNTKRWADKAILREVNGITYTLHYEYTQRDITLLRRLSLYLCESDTYKMNNRLFIDSRLKSEFDLKDLGIDHWDSVRWIQWKEDECPVKENEELIFYDLENERDKGGMTY